MKKLFLSLSVLASMLVTGCSSDDADTGNETDNNYSTHYLSVNIVSADGSSATRTDGEEYEDGSENENKVSSIRFYFFTENGTAANVKLSPSGTSYLNYYDWPNDSIVQVTSSDATNHEESMIKATIILNTRKGDQLPRTMVAILNPNTDLISKGPQGLTTLRAISHDYAKADLTTKGKFVMANSVYGEGEPKKEVCPVYIMNDNICDTPDEARETPVKIYVERNVAKVKTSLKDGLFTDGKLKLKYKGADGVDITAEEDDEVQQVYLKLDGWALTCEMDKGYLTKRINPAWTTTWWYEGYKYHRCTWAVNASDANPKWTPKYSTISQRFGVDSLYTNENAAPFSDGEGTANLYHTKIIVKGVLCDESGDSLTLARHMGTLFVDTCSTYEGKGLPKLRSSILQHLKDSETTYWTGTDTGRRTIDSTDIAIEPYPIIKKEESNNNCYVFAKLTTEAEGKTWYKSAEGDETITAAEINTVLKDRAKIGDALVWKDGQTYYYMNIIHRNVTSETEPTYGVVRNHVYKARITDIAGLGTPVYNPDEVIYPEMPDPDDHYIAAEIRILSWRVISDDYQLYW